MLERNPGQGPEDNSYFTKVAREVILCGILGGLAGGSGYGVARLLTDASHSERWGLGAGGLSTFVSLGAMMSNLSLEQAEMLHRYGRRRESRLMLIQSVIESAAGFGAGMGLAGFEINGITGALIGSGMGLAIAGHSVYSRFRERIEPLPELEFPSGNTTFKDTVFPDRYDGRLLPPVYRASSLQDFIEFREINKMRLVEKRVKKSVEVPGLSDIPSHYIPDIKYLTAVAIVPNVRHDVKDDPETSRGMDLSDGAVNIIAHPCQDSYWFWPNPTIFDDVFGSSRYSNEERWDNQRNISWENMVLLLCQYQAAGPVDQKMPQPDQVLDNYWLLDINLAHGGGDKRRIKRRRRSFLKLPWSDPLPAPQGI